MFDFGKANQAQREAISAAEGPVLIIAGPGTGKTFTLVQRTVYLIQECGVKAKQIFIATFTEKAAKELVTRITDELARRRIGANINDMYIGTFHSLCSRILKENLEYTQLGKEFRILDSFDQQFMVYRKFKDRFLRLPNFRELFPEGSWWQISGNICKYVNKLTEEMVDPDALMSDQNPKVAAIGLIMKVYKDILKGENQVDFSTLQVETYRLLKNHPEVLKGRQPKITHIMVDEYQDTNYIEEQIVFLLAGGSKNICVVGDDDQGLYRFRGATIQNILEFPKKFAENECRIIKLVTNYRSNSDIIDLYNEWMAIPYEVTTPFQWNIFRHNKRIVPNKKTAHHSPAAVKIDGAKDESVWHERILKFITKLKETGKISDYNQIAFLFSSVKSDEAARLARYLESHRIKVYSPRSNMFFDRPEVRLSLGCLLHMFPQYLRGLENEKSYPHIEYYKQCASLASRYLDDSKNKTLRKWIKRKGKAHEKLSDSTGYTYCDLLYEMFQFPPFSDYLDSDLKANVAAVRPSRNLANLTRRIGKFEQRYNIDNLPARPANVYGKEMRLIDYYTDQLFNRYLNFLFYEGVNEYEDDKKYAPSGCVSFMTIHQAKGMEFPIVLVGSLDRKPTSYSEDFMDVIGAKYFRRKPCEPIEHIKYFDFWRVYYTAFSRAQNLLVLTCGKKPSDCFSGIFDRLRSVDDPDFDLSEFDFNPVKDVNVKNTYSFTSHIAVYQTCPRQYKFFKELGFKPARTVSELIGSLIHATIEDIHRAVIRKIAHPVIRENIPEWFEFNYAALSEARHVYLNRRQREDALNQVFRYFDNYEKLWFGIRRAEYDVSFVKSDYIIGGKIDLVRGKGKTIEIVDFKSGPKPALSKRDKKLEMYKSQLHIYAYLIQRGTTNKVSNLRLYYTGEESGDPMITFPYDETDVQRTMADFDSVVRKIMDKNFSGCADDPKTCRRCDFYYYCKAKEDFIQND